MEYEKTTPVTKGDRSARRKRERSASQHKEERNRKRSLGGGQPNELGVTQGQNGEQGNTMDPRNAQPIGQPGSE
jgi:hypothetical protein